VAAHAVELGGGVSRPPTPFAWGRYAVLRDPQGAAFSILESTG
jgi:predicted enzyme related to lactoylglutathione lyase